MIAVPSTPNASPQVAMVGGGQLARMTHQAAIAMGQSLRVLAADASDPAAQVSPDVVIGSHTDLEALRRVAAGGPDGRAGGHARLGMSERGHL